MSGSSAVERLRDAGQPIGDIYLRRDEISGGGEEWRTVARSCTWITVKAVFHEFKDAVGLAERHRTTRAIRCKHGEG